MNEIRALINDLFIDRDRFSTSGLEIYNKIRKKLNLETTKEIDNNLELLDKKFGSKKVKQMLEDKTSNQFEIELIKMKAR